MARLDYRGEVKNDKLRQLGQMVQARVNSIDAYLQIADNATAQQVRDEVKRIDQTQRGILEAIAVFVKREMR